MEHPITRPFIDQAQRHQVLNKQNEIDEEYGLSLQQLTMAQYLDKLRFMDRETIAEAYKAFRTYIQILDDEGRGPPTTADIDHSSLLYRLFSGKKPLQIPAPTFHSYPCYSLGEGLRVKAPEVYEYDKRVIIGQNGEFTKLSSSSVRYDRTGEVFEFSRPLDDPWKYQPWNDQGPLPDDQLLYMQKTKAKVSRIRVKPDAKLGKLNNEIARVVSDSDGYYEVIFENKDVANDKYYADRNPCISKCSTIIVSYEPS